VPERLGHELAANLGAVPHELAQVEMVFPLAAAGPGAAGPDAPAAPRP